MSPIAFLKCLRPKQWTKNLLLFAGILFTRQWNDQQMVFHAVAAFAIFCALSGVVYICNDILDVEKDREHPKKKYRPIASGAISPAIAGIGALLLCAGALTGAWMLTPTFFVCSVIYVALVSAYSFQFKHMVVLDILSLALGFVVRAIAGVEVLHVPGRPAPELTSYFILTTLFLALFLAIGKRRSELMTMGASAGKTRAVLADYNEPFLNILLAVATTGVILNYGTWAASGKFATIGGSYTMIFTMPLVLYGVFRYLWLIFKKDEGGAPDHLLLTDVPLLATVLLWVLTVTAILAFSPKAAVLEAPPTPPAPAATS